MGVDALIARMTGDAQARMAALRAEADAEVAEFERARSQAASADRSRVLDERRAQRQSAFAAERAQARRRAAARVLAAQHAFVDRIFARAEALGAAAGADARCLEALPRQLDAVAVHLGGQPATVRCRPELAPALQRCAAALCGVEITVDATLPVGFVAVTGDGRCTIDCTVPALLSALRPRLQAALLARVPA
jgi:vacuolar-type H+-ATPase subunit E/Vma4